MKIYILKVEQTDFHLDDTNSDQGNYRIKVRLSLEQYRVIYVCTKSINKDVLSYREELCSES